MDSLLSDPINMKNVLGQETESKQETSLLATRTKSFFSLRSQILLILPSVKVIQAVLLNLNSQLCAAFSKIFKQQIESYSYCYLYTIFCNTIAL